MIGWGIWGSGAIARRFADALALADGGRLVAVASRTEANAQAFAGRFGAQAEPGYDALLARADVAVVYIATPNHSHKADALKAIAAGKAVLCEKPMCMSADDAREVAAAARAAGVFCMEGLWTHFIPAVQDAAKAVKAGAIGELKSLTVSFGSAHVTEPGSALFDPAQGGGALLDRGVYAVSLALRFMGGTPVSVVAERVMEGGVDVAADAVLRFEGGRTATLGVSINDFRANDLVLAGSHGRLKLHEHVTSPDALSLWSYAPVGSGGGAYSGGGLKARVKEAIKANAALAPLKFLARQKLKPVPFRGNGMVHEIDEVHACLKAGRLESETAPLSLSIATLEVLDALRA